ncbi:ankyrin repeat-containing domain protein [Xylariaceae sp. FL0016]|nr:ankyrin repeat-containing domain protein [Xylariaceae sp. FL0016]
MATMAAENPTEVTSANSGSPIVNLPLDILFKISNYLRGQKNRLTLAKTCRDMSVVFLKEIYERESKFEDLHPLAWALANGRQDILHRITLTFDIQDIINHPFAHGHRVKKKGSKVCKYSTPLVTAIKRADHACIKRVVALGADVQQPDNTAIAGHTMRWFPVNWAIKVALIKDRGNVETLKLLKLAGSDLDNAPIPHGSAGVNPDPLDQYIDKTTIEYLTQEETQPIFQVLQLPALSQPADHPSCLSTAEIYDTSLSIDLTHRSELLEELLSSGANPNLQCNLTGLPPMLHMVTCILRYTVKFWFSITIASRTEKDTQRTMILNHAVYFLNILGKHKANVNQEVEVDFGTGHRGTTTTAAHMTCRLDPFFRPTVINCLMNWGLDFSVRDNLGRMPLFEFCRNVQHDIDGLRQFLDQGAKSYINAQDLYGRTALHEICSMIKEGGLDEVKLMVKYGADPDIKDSDDRVPAQYLWVQDLSNELDAETCKQMVCMDRRAFDYLRQVSKQETRGHKGNNHKTASGMSNARPERRNATDRKHNEGWIAPEDEGPLSEHEPQTQARAPGWEKKTSPQGSHQSELKRHNKIPNSDEGKTLFQQQTRGSDTKLQIKKPKPTHQQIRERRRPK